MNILLFTTAMVLLLASLTYARLEMYRNLSLLQGEFNRYMMTSERSAINEQAETWYATSVASKRAGQGQQKGKKQALSRLSFIVFVDSKKQGAYTEEYAQLVALAKRLFAVLYENQSFYEEAKQKNPNIDSELLNSLLLAEKLPKEQKISRAADLANLNLENPDLNDLFYKMLQGTMSPDQLPSATPPLAECQLEGYYGEEDDEGIEPGKAEEVKSPQGYYSLLDFITLQDAAKVRVYLASKPLLMAIFGDMGVVNSIIQERCSLYNNVVNGTITSDQAMESLRSRFLSQAQGQGFDEKILDFTVTKTNPRNYE